MAEPVRKYRVTWYRFDYATKTTDTECTVVAAFTAADAVTQVRVSYGADVRIEKIEPVGESENG